MNQVNRLNRTIALIFAAAILVAIVTTHVKIFLITLKQKSHDKQNQLQRRLLVL